MASSNSVRLLGNLGSAPELRKTPRGVDVCNFRMATNERYKDSSGKAQERTEWHRIVVWGAAAVNAQKYLTTGARILVEGALRTREWEDKKLKDENGKPIQRYTTEVHVGNGGLTFLDRKVQGNRPSNQEMADEFETLSDDDVPSQTVEESNEAPISDVDVPF